MHRLRPDDSAGPLGRRAAPEQRGAADRWAPQAPTRRWVLAAGFVAMLLAAFAWAKWTPYWHKIPALARTGDLGPSVLGSDASASGVSLTAGWDFLTSYLRAVWPAVITGLVTAAGLQTLVPGPWLARAFSRPGRVGRASGSVRAVAAGLPMMLCTCCAAPVAVALRRSRVPTAPALAYWLATPALNPAVMVFAVLALSPAWMALRLAAGAAVVAVVVAVATRHDSALPADEAARLAGADPQSLERSSPRQPAGLAAFARELAHLGARLVPEYLALIFVLGALRGVLFPLGHDLASWGVAAVLLLAVAGTLLAVPTGAEVAVVAALLAAGAPAWLAAPLLVTLPVTSLPSLAMVSRSFPRRLLVGVPATVVAAGLLTSGAALSLGL